MSGVLLLPGSSGGPQDWAPDLSADGQLTVARLFQRHKELIGGIKIIGPNWAKGVTPGTGQEESGTLGVLLQDANNPDIAYGLTALHLLTEAAKHAAVTLQRGHAVYHPTQLYAGPQAITTCIGWLIAMYDKFDVALIGIRPGLRWRPEIDTLGPTNGGVPFVDSFIDHPDPVNSPGPRIVQFWNFDPPPAMGSLPTSGPTVSKVGIRTGLTTGRAYRLTAHTTKYGSIPLPPAGASLADQKAWSLMVARYLADPRMADSVPKMLGTDPDLYLCVPDPVAGSPTALTSFQQKGDSGSVLVDEKGVVVGIINDIEYKDVFTRNFVAGLALPIDLALETLKADLEEHYGPPTGADWPTPEIPAGAPVGQVRRVPKKPLPRWYTLVQADIKSAP